MHKGNADAKAMLPTTKKFEVRVIDKEDAMDSSTAEIVIKGDGKNMETMIDALKKDGLIKGNDVQLNIKNDKISINGKELSPETAKKYEAYLNKK
jgi:hypothetical protein